MTAAEQTAGRGRRGRPWTTGRRNLAASVLLIDPAPPAVAATISFVAAVAVHQAIVDVAGPPVAERLALKWPNDLLLDRRKVAGILVEGEGLADGRFAVVIGFGVNCASHPDIDTPVPADDLASRGVPVEAEPLFAALAQCLATELIRWDAGAGFAAVRSAWLARAVGVGEPIRVNLEGRTVDGRFEDLDAEGRLVLVGTGGVRQRFSVGDVSFAAIG